MDDGSDDRADEPMAIDSPVPPASPREAQNTLAAVRTELSVSWRVSHACSSVFMLLDFVDETLFTEGGVEGGLLLPQNAEDTRITCSVIRDAVNITHLPQLCSRMPALARTQEEKVTDPGYATCRCLSHTTPSVARPMSCMPGYRKVIYHHTVGSQTIPKSGIKWI